MSIDFSKHKKGDVVRVHCCDSCARAAGVQPKYPPDSGKESWLCEVCGHFGIGSATDCKIGAWLSLQPNNCFNLSHTYGVRRLSKCYNRTGMTWGNFVPVIEEKSKKY